MDTLKKLLPYLLSVVAVFGIALYADSKISNLKFDYVKQQKELDRLHKQELDTLAAARAQEKAELQANIVKLQEDLLKNQKDYEKKLREINEKKEKEAKELAAKAPADLAQEVAAATGFKVYKK